MEGHKIELEEIYTSPPVRSSEVVPRQKNKSIALLYSTWKSQSGMFGLYFATYNAFVPWWLSG